MKTFQVSEGISVTVPLKGGNRGHGLAGVPGDGVLFLASRDIIISLSF